MLEPNNLQKVAILDGDVQEVLVGRELLLLANDDSLKDLGGKWAAQNTNLGELSLWVSRLVLDVLH
jgi:hypothetical protein